MDNFNKIISFVLGLIVVVVILVILAGKFDLRGKFLPLSEGTKKTNLTPSPKATTQKIDSTVKANQNTNQKGDPFFQPYKKDGSSTGSLTTIPKTGAATLLLPLAVSALGIGMYLRRRK